MSELDIAHLARLNLTGGNIHNIALIAAFLAAKSNAQVSMPLVLEAARSELRKMGQPVNEGLLRWQAPVNPEPLPVEGLQQ